MKIQVPVVSTLVLACLLTGTPGNASADPQTLAVKAGNAKSLMLAMQTRQPTSPPQADPSSVNMNTPITRLPDGAFFEDTRFNARQLRALRGADISSARDLIEADPVALGRLLDIEPRQASMNQHNLRENVMDRTPASRAAQATQNLGLNSSVRQIPGDSFLPQGRLRNTQVRTLENAGIRTVRDLLDTSPIALGRVLDLEVRQAASAQYRLTDLVYGNRGVTSQEPGRGALSPDTSVASMPAGAFLPNNGRFNRNQIRGLQKAGIDTAADLAEANPLRVAQIFRMNSEQTRAAQGRLQKALYD